MAPSGWLANAAHKAGVVGPGHHVLYEDRATGALAPAYMLTTVRGYVKVELQDASTGAALPGFALADSVPSMGNYLDRVQRWMNATALPAAKVIMPM